MLLLWLDPISWARTVGAAACASLALWCALGALLARTLRTPRRWRILNLAMGALLAASIVYIWS